MALIKRHGVTIDTGLHTDMETVVTIMVFRSIGRNGKMAVYTDNKKPRIIAKAKHINEAHRRWLRKGKSTPVRGTAVVYIMGEHRTLIVAATNPLFAAYVKHIVGQTVSDLQGRDWTSGTTMAKAATVARDKGLDAAGIDMSNPPRGMIKVLREVRAKAKAILPPKPLPYGLLDD